MSDAPLRILYVDDDPALARLVQRGLGMSVLPPAVVANEVRLGQLHAVTIDQPALLRTVGLARREREEKQ